MAVDDPDEQTSGTSEGNRRIRQVREPAEAGSGHETDTVTDPLSRTLSPSRENSTGSGDPTEPERPHPAPEGSVEETDPETEHSPDHRSPTVLEERAKHEPGPQWHSASRDWIICSGIMVFLSILLFTVLIVLDVLKNIMLMGFFGFFLAFLLFIALYFLIKARALNSFLAMYVGHRRDAEGFVQAFEEALRKEGIEPVEDSPCITGHTFGLLADVRTMKLPTNEIVEINSFHITAGFVLGLYILVGPDPSSSSSGSMAITLLDEMISTRSPLSHSVPIRGDH